MEFTPRITVQDDGIELFQEPATQCTICHETFQAEQRVEFVVVSSFVSRASVPW